MMLGFEPRSQPIDIDGMALHVFEWLDTHYNLSGEYLTCSTAIGFLRTDRNDYEYFVYVRYFVPIGPAIPHALFSGSPSNMDWNRPGVFLVWGEGIEKQRFEQWDDAIKIFEDFRRTISESYKSRIDFLKSIGVEGFE